MEYNCQYYESIKRQFGLISNEAKIIEFLFCLYQIGLKKKGGIYYEFYRKQVSEILSIRPGTLKRRVDSLKERGLIRLSSNSTYFIITDEFFLSVKDSLSTDFHNNKIFQNNLTFLRELVLRHRNRLAKMRFEVDESSPNSFRATRIYFLKDKYTGWTKIGRTQNIKSRFKTYIIGNPTIELIFYFEGVEIDEKIIHNMFQEKWKQGEWFDLTVDDLDKIYQILKENNKEIKHLNR